MSRIELILDLHKKKFFWEKSSLINALIATMTVEEACSLFDLKLSFDLRRPTLKKISNDMSHEFSDIHKSLIMRLMTSYKSLPYIHKKGCNHALGLLHPSMPENLGLEVIQFLSRLKYIGARRKAYKLMQSDWKSEYIGLLKKDWEQYKDKECAHLIINEFSIVFIQENLDVLEEVLLKAGLRHLSRLYIRIGESDFERVERLRYIDEITYTYVCSKIGKKLSEREALEIFEKNRIDERVGLLIWSFGQLGLWSVLENIVSRVDDLQLEKLEVLRKDLIA